MEKTCKTCMENDCGLCDRTGRLVEDDDQCEKWVSNQPEWKTKNDADVPCRTLRRTKWSKNCMR